MPLPQCGEHVGDKKERGCTEYHIKAIVPEIEPLRIAFSELDVGKACRHHLLPGEF
jgi:hypothetical protein